MRLPSSVKGLRLGILIDGITSCGAVPLSSIPDDCCGSSSSLIVRAWLAISSDSEAVMEPLRDETPLIPEAEPRVGSIRGVIDCERVFEAARLTLFDVASDTKDISSAWESASLMSEAALDARSWPKGCFDELLGPCSDDPAVPCCFRGSRPAVVKLVSDCSKAASKAASSPRK